MTSPANGVILLDKPAGLTSFQSLSFLKRTLGTKKVGHAGTLDKFATGLLIVLVGKATKLASLLLGLDKQYEAVFRFGAETETLDPEGMITEQAALPTRAAIDKAVELFTGEIEQSPPQYSAVHIGGKRAYRLARAGVTVDMPSRRIVVSELLVRDYVPPDCSVSIRCSSGTYVRSLARDIARGAESRAHVQELRRTAIGPFSISDAVSPEGFSTVSSLLTIESIVPRIPGISVATASDRLAASMTTGGQVSDRDLTGELGDRVAVLGRDGGFLALVERHGARYRYLFNAGGRS